MPELPEVEVVRQGLAPLVRGRRVVRFQAANKKLRRPVPRAAIKRWIVGREITAVNRRARYLCLVLDNGAWLVIHLGMTGRLGVFDGGEVLLKHDHLRFLLDDGMEMRFHDPRRFGSIQVLSPAAAASGEFFVGLGPEPFSDGFSAGYLLRKARGRRQPVKNFLMDNRVVVGIGNIYANEALFAAGIGPATRAGSLDRPEWKRLVAACRTVLHRAIASGGTTISDFVNAGGRPGYFQLELAVYGRPGEPCPRCRTRIEKTVLAGRATFFCPNCQP